MKKVLLFSLIVFLLVGCKEIIIQSGNPIKGNGVIVEKNIDANHINKINQETVFDIIIVQTNNQKIKIVTDENILNYIKHSEIENEIIFSQTENVNLQPTKAEIQISLEQLSKLINSGTGDVICDNLSISRGFRIINSGTGDIKIKNIVGESANFKNSGTGSFLASGIINNLDLINSGTGDFNLINLDSEILNLTNSGTGNSEVTANQKLSIDNTGTGDVYFKGNPLTREFNNSGTGNIKEK